MPSPFSSSYQVTLPHPLHHTFDELSSQSAFEAFIKLSPTTHTIEILDVEHPSLSNDYINQILEDSKNKPEKTTTGIYPQRDAAGPPSNDSPAVGDLKATRYRFKLVERIPILGGVYKNDVAILGSQIVIDSRHLHLYETSANGGMVNVLKIRQFEADGEKTRISEQIRGDTNWLLRKYTEGACRKAHQDHMNKYHELMQPKS